MVVVNQSGGGAVLDQVDADLVGSDQVEISTLDSVYTVTILKLQCDTDVCNTVTSNEDCYLTLSTDRSLNPKILIDSAATKHVIGKDCLPYAINRRKLAHPVTLYTANNTITVYEQGDLPGFNGTFTDALIVHCCSKSLYGAVYACKKHNMGFNINQG